MRPRVIPNLREGYVEVIEEIRRHGKVVSPRGYKTWEIEDACFEVADPSKLLPYGTGRNPKPAIPAAEALLLCAGLASPSLMTSITVTFKRFLDGGQLHGAYGPRVRPQFEMVLDRLRGDRDTRQAIMQIWDPAYDCVDTRDLPCTLGFGFRLRDDGLHMSTVMRSQDAWLGLAYDLFFFGQLGWTYANALGVELASLRHHAYSLHVYERNVDDLDKLGVRHIPGDDVFIEPTGFGYAGGAVDYEQVRGRAERIYNRDESRPAADKYWTPSERWYRTLLDPYDRLTRTANFAS